MPALFQWLGIELRVWAVFLAAMLGMLTGSPTAAQDAAAARKVLGELREVSLPQYYTVRAATAIQGEAFAVAASAYADDVLTPYALVLLPDGRVVTETPIKLPPGDWPLGGRIDRLVTKPGGGVYGVGHVSASPDQQVGWIVELSDAMETVATVTLPPPKKERTRLFLYAVAIDKRGDLVVAGRAGEPGRAKPVDGVVARVSRKDLRPLGRAKLIGTRSKRWGIQDLVLDDQGKAIVVGWMENQAKLQNKDDFIVLRLNQALNSEGGYSSGGVGNDIAYRVLKRGDSFTLLARNARGRRSVAAAYALNNETKLSHRVRATRDLQGQGPQAFRSGVHLPDGALVLFGMSAVDAKSDTRRLFGMVMGDQTGETILAKGCRKSRAWDAAATKGGALIVVNDCVLAGQQRQSAMVLIRSAAAAAAPTATQPRQTARPVYTAKLTSSDGRVAREAVATDLSGPVKVFVAANGSATVSMVEADGRIIDVQTATTDHPALLVGELDDSGQFLEVETDEAQVEVTVSVHKKASASGRDAAAAIEALTFSAGEIDEVMRGLRWVEAIGDERSGRLIRGAAPSAALRRRLATYQFSRNLPPSGYFDDRTRLQIALDAGVAVQRAAEKTVAEAETAARSDRAERLIGANGREIARGAWRGAIFIGGIRGGYIGEWARDEAGVMLPNGLGTAPETGSDQRYIGEFRDGVPYGYGAVIGRSGDLAQRGEFRGTLRGYGAFFRNGASAQTGLFAARGNLLKSIRP